MSDKFKISELTSEKLINYAKIADTLGNNDGNISKKEFKNLQTLLNGDQAAKAALADENDNIKKLFGYSGSVNASKTEVQKAESNNDKKEEAKTNVKEAAKGVKEAYYSYRGIDPVTREPLIDEEGNPVKGMSPEEAYNKVMNDYKDANGNLKKEFKQAVKDLRKYSIDTEAKLVVIDAVDRATKSNKSKDVKKAAEEILRKEGNWDEHTQKALNGKNHNWWSNALNWLSLKDSEMKQIRKAQAAGNNATERAGGKYSEKQFTDAIGKTSPLFKKDEKGFMAILKLVNPDDRQEQLVKKVGEDQYDISALSKFISQQIGADNTLSRQQNKADAELEAIRSEFRKQGIELTKRDTKQLIEFCGYRVEHKNWVRAAYMGSVGAVAAAGGTAVALATQARDIVRGVFNNHNYLELNLKVDQSMVQSILNDSEMQRLISENAAQVTNTSAGVQIIIDQKYVQPFFHVASKHIALNALKSAGIGALAGLAASLLEYGPSEEDVFSTRFKSGPSDCEEDYVPKTYEEFLRYVDSRKELNDTQKLALKQIAMHFIQEDNSGEAVTTELEVAKTDDKGMAVLGADGKPVIETVTEMAWDAKGFQNYMNGQAGYTSDLNGIELLRAVQNAPDCLTQETTTPPPKEEDTPKKEIKTYTGSYITKEGEVVRTLAPKTEKFEDWGVFASRYKCIEEHDPKFKIYEKSKNANSYARTMMKVMQAITNDDYDLARLQDLTEKAMSRNWRSELQNEKGFNFNNYAALRGNKSDNTFAIDRQKMPTITTVDGGNVVSDLCAPTENPLYTLGRQSGGTSTKINLGDANNVRKGEKSFEGGFRTSDGKQISVPNEDAYDNMKKKLHEEDHYEWREPDQFGQ